MPKNVLHKIPNIAEGEKIISDLLKWLNISINDSTKDTPARVAKMYVNDLMKGLYIDAPPIKTFKEKNTGYVCVTDIYFTSLCEHHLLPFIGKCGIVYFPKSSVIGISKIPRIVDYWSSRPQLQERLTNQIAEDIMKRLKPYGVYVAMSAEHLCSTIRGIKARGCITNTAQMLGDIDKGEAIELLSVKSFLKD